MNGQVAVAVVSEGETGSLDLAFEVVEVLASVSDSSVSTVPVSKPVPEDVRIEGEEVAGPHKRGCHPQAKTLITIPLLHCFVHLLSGQEMRLRPIMGL